MSYHKRLGRFDMAYNTERSKRYYDEALERVEKAKTDARRLERLNACECRSCFYLTSRVGGCAITESQCGICMERMSFVSTCTDRICRSCAREHSMCAHCGGDLEMRPRRRKWPEDLEDNS